MFLVAVSVFETQTHWIEQELNKIAERFMPQTPYSIELHGSPMRSGREGWKIYSLVERLQAIKDALQIGIANYHHRRHVRLFAVVLNKNALVGTDPIEEAFEQISSRFDLFLKRLYRKHNDQQRGIILLDKSSTERRIQTLAREFKYTGHTWGNLPDRFKPEK